MKERGWDKIFIFIDIHETILKPNWDADNVPKEFYPFAKEVLQRMSKRKDMCLVLYTCSYEPEIQEYLRFFKSHDIIFSYVNENPEAKNTRYGSFDKKPYMNVLLEDKAGFDAVGENGINDWCKINEVLDVLDERAEALENIKDFVKSTPKEELEERLKSIQQAWKPFLEPNTGLKTMPELPPTNDPEWAKARAEGISPLVWLMAKKIKEEINKNI